MQNETSCTGRGWKGKELSHAACGLIIRGRTGTQISEVLVGGGVRQIILQWKSLIFVVFFYVFYKFEFFCRRLQTR